MVAGSSPAGPTISCRRLSEMQFDVITWLASPALTLGATRLSIAEVLRRLQLACGASGSPPGLTSQTSRSGLPTVALLLLLFFNAGLFADAALQVLFISLGIRGWIQWSRFGRDTTTAVSTRNVSLADDLRPARSNLVGGLRAVAAQGRRQSAAIDALIASLSVVAQWWLNRKDPAILVVVDCGRPDFFHPRVRRATILSHSAALRRVSRIVRVRLPRLAGGAAPQPQYASAASRMTHSFRHGLVIGKFYPPHNGHEYLIRCAASQCDQVSVVVYGCRRRAHRARTACPLADGNPRRSTPRDRNRRDRQRCRRLRQRKRLACPRRAYAARTDSRRRGKDFTCSCGGCRLHLRTVWRRAGAPLRCRFGVRRPDARATSDIGHGVPRGSGGPVVQQWLPCVRRFLCRRVAIVGAESTGKTTLAAALQQAFRARDGVLASTRTVPEFGREYTERKLARARAQQADFPLEKLEWSSADSTIDRARSGRARRMLPRESRARC